jgi:hypothetical protein
MGSTLLNFRHHWLCSALLSSLALHVPGGPNKLPNSDQEPAESPVRDAATGEVSDMQLEYLRPEQLQLQPGDLPKKGRWPHIRAPRWPFDADLVSHDLMLTSNLPSSSLHSHCHSPN